MSTTESDALTVAHYDAMPYPDEAYRDAFVQRAATMALLHGIVPPPVERCRVLDIGCAGGEHLMAMASMLPHSEFVGIDVSPVQVQKARNAASRMGLRNVRIECASLQALDATWGRFDYIVAHGVYSWIAPPLQAALLAACAERLSDTGVAYISHNTYPGWHAAGAVRSLMTYAGRDAETLSGAIQQAQAMLQLVHDAAGQEPDREYAGLSDAYRASLSADVKQVQKHESHYLAHEYLAPFNEPLYFHEFIKRAESAGLQFLADAALHVDAFPELRPQLIEHLQRIGAGRLEREQYLDFVVGRRFRKSLLVKSSCAVAPELSLQAADSLFIAVDYYRPQWRGEGAQRLGSFNMADSTTLAPANALTCAVLEAAHACWPKAMRLDAAFDEAGVRLGLDRASPGWAAEFENAQAELLDAFRRYQISLMTTQPASVPQVQQRPTANAWVRDRIRRGLDLTRPNDFRSIPEPPDIWFDLLPRLDGRCTLDQLVETIAREAIKDHASSDEVRRTRRDRIERGVRNILGELAYHGMLVESPFEHGRQDDACTGATIDGVSAAPGIQPAHV